MSRQNIKFFIFILLILSASACKKYLDKKPDKSLQVPSSIQDLQAVLDNGNLMNGHYGVSFDESSADNFYLKDDVFNSFNQENRNAYVWSNINYSNYPNDWSYVYWVVNAANVVLDNLQNISFTEQDETSWKNVKGSALFFRAYGFLQGAYIFCKAYDENTADQDLGMALRLSSDFNVPSKRASLSETYSRILEDLKDAASLLPDFPQHDFRPSKVSTFALLARTFLSMRMYDSCYNYANLALQLKSDLMDYNDISQTASYPFARFNKEVYFDNTIAQPNYYLSHPYYALVDTVLFQSYDTNDLRRVLYFSSVTNGHSFKGSYAQYNPFIGLATDEVYLMRAECEARRGDKNDALADLNTLMSRRWIKGLFIPFSAATPKDALDIILRERRKELIFRNIRWMDIKRLNLDGENISLKRIENGQAFELEPNDSHFALPLPSDITALPGMPQNPY